MPNAADLAADEIRAFSVDLERFSADIRNRALEFLRKLEEELIALLRKHDLGEVTLTSAKQRRMEKLLEQTQATIATAYAGIRDEVKADLREVAALSAANAGGSINAAVGVDIATTALAQERIRALADDTLVMGAPTRQWWSDQAASVLKNFRDQVQRGYASGEGVDEIVRRIRGTRALNYTDGTMNIARRNAEALVRSSVQAISNSARNETFENNKDIAENFMQISTLDGRTSVQCIARSNLQWNIETKAPVGHFIPWNGGPPLHWNALASGTMIETYHGPKRIEDIRPGDHVLTHLGRFKPVYAVMSKRNKSGVIRIIETESGRMVRATDEHPILTHSDGWKRADDIHVGDQLFEDTKELDGKEPLLCVARAADNYPSPFHETDVFDRITVDPASVPSSVHFQSDFVIREGKISHGFVNVELMNEGKPGVCQDGVNLQLGSRNLSPIPVNDVLSNSLSGVIEQDRVLFSHAPAMRSVSMVGFLGETKSPVALPPLMVGGIASREGCRILLRANGDPVSLAPVHESSLSQTKFSLDFSHGLPVSEMLPLNDFGDDIPVTESDRTHWSLSSVSSIIIDNYSDDVYNIAVLDDESYLANGIIVHNCRSVTVAVLKPLTDLPSRKKAKVETAGMRASMDGEVPADTTYSDFLNSKGEEFQKDVLGEGRWRLWKDGKLDLRDMLDQRGNPLSLAELRRRYGGG